MLIIVELLRTNFSLEKLIESGIGYYMFYFFFKYETSLIADLNSTMNNISNILDVIESINDIFGTWLFPIFMIYLPVVIIFIFTSTGIVFSNVPFNVRQNYLSLSTD